MAVSGDGRNRLLIPVAIILTAVWLAAGVRAVYSGDVQPFVVASAPFGILCGYLFGATLIRGKQ